MQEAQECCTSAGWHIEVCNGVRCVECCNSSEVTEGTLVSDRGSFNIERMFLAQQGGQLGDFLFLELLEKQHLGEVLHAEHSNGSGLGSS